MSFLNSLWNHARRNDYPPYSRDLIKKYGQYKIKSITIGRKPLNTILNSTARYFSYNKDYSHYFHLYMIVTLENNVRLRVEKTQVIVISSQIPPKSDLDEYFNLNISHHPTLYQFLENSRRIRPHFHIYQAGSYNCQRFINELLIDNNMWNEQANHFIMQDVRDIFENNTTLRRFVNTMTDVAAQGDILINGRSVRRYR